MTERRRIAALPPRLGTLGSAVAFVPRDEREQERFRNDQPWRKWYWTPRWRALRAKVLLRDLYTCQRCHRVEPDTSQLVADHREPHRGDETLFWSEGNLQCLCKPCHDRDKQRDEVRAARRGGGSKV